MAEPAGLIDAHCHLVLPGRAGVARDFVSERMRSSLLFRLIRRRYGGIDDPAELGAAYVGRLRRDLAGSRRVGAVVLLALDAAYGDDGERDLAATHLFVSNDAVLELAQSEPGFLAGASINPRRKDAVDEVARVAAGGAVLVKWLPNAQSFDPADERNRPLFEALRQHRLPLLVHSGVEYSVVHSRFHRGGDPDRWRLALDCGVDVIAAHAGSGGRFLGERHRGVLFELMRRYPNLYADSSALLIPSRAGMLRHLRRSPAALARLTFGSDYPLPSFPSLALALGGSVRGFLRARAERNYFDRQVELFRTLGWEPSSTVLEQLIARLPSARAARP